jgi:hypothetical protein
MEFFETGLIVKMFEAAVAKTMHGGAPQGAPLAQISLFILRKRTPRYDQNDRSD